MSVFLSFSSKNRDEARALKQAIEKARPDLDVFLDETHLKHGYFWQPTLFKEIDQRDAFILLVGHHIGPWQRQEYYHAFNRKAVEHNDAENEGVEEKFILLPIITIERQKAFQINLPGLPQLNWQEHNNPSSEDSVQQILKALDGETIEQVDRWKIFNPYRGLRALREQDSDYLFGRDNDITNFMTSMSEQSDKLLLLLGASGVGKSSMVFAGIFAALEQGKLPNGDNLPPALAGSQQWPRLILSPGTDPLESLAGAFLSQWHDTKEADYRDKLLGWKNLLAKGDSINGLVNAIDTAISEQKGDPPAHYVIYVDQGEELYTRAGREPSRDGTKKETPQQKQARLFSQLLAEAAKHPRLTVIMSARSDFLDRLQADSFIIDNQQKIDLNPLSPEGISEVVRKPAELFDVTFDQKLDETLIESSREHVGGLPLLSDALDTLWQEMQERGDGILKWIDPKNRDIDVARKLADRADAFIAKNRDKETDIRRLFCVKLAHVPHQGKPTRKTAYLKDLTETEKKLAEDLAAPDQRIIVAGEKDGKLFAEVAHEALFEAWDRLRNWIEDRRSFYAWSTELSATYQDYQSRGSKRKDLLKGRPLEKSRAFLETNKAEISDAEQEFIKRSLKRERNNWIGGITIVIGVILALAGLAGMAYKGQIEANTQKELAQKNLEQAQLTQSKFLRDETKRKIEEGDATTAILLGLTALPDKNSALKTQQTRPFYAPAHVSLDTAFRNNLEKAILKGHTDRVYSVAFSPDGTKLVSGSWGKGHRTPCVCGMWRVATAL